MQELDVLTEIRDLLKQLVEARVRPAATTGGDVQLHPKTKEAMEKHAPPMTEGEIDDVLERYWSRHQTHRNAANYANVLPGKNFHEQMAAASRHFFWLKREKKIEYDHKFKVMKICP